MSQILDGLPFHDLSEDHLNSLQLLRVPEGPRLEFKGDLKLASNTEKRELCKDIPHLQIHWSDTSYLVLPRPTA